jgi:HEAT repeat protein
LNSEKSLNILLRLIEDPEPVVRAQAAKAFGKMKNVEAIEILTKSLKDLSFWVRQNAASSLFSTGEQGLLRLREIAEKSEDPFASDAAKQEIRKYELYLKAGGKPV